MGYYIEGPALGKVDFICRSYGAKVVEADNLWQYETAFDLQHVGLVVVIDNGPFQAACFCYNKGEFYRCLDPNDDRPKTVLVGDYSVLAKAAGYLVAEGS